MGIPLRTLQRMGYNISDDGQVERMGFEKNKALVIDHHNKRVTETIGGKDCKFRSVLERNYAAYLQFLKEHGVIRDWAFEQTKFTFKDETRGAKEYLIDFDVLNNDGSFEYHECKGWLKGSDVTKFRRVKKYRPEVVIYLILSGKSNKAGVLNRIRQISKYADRVAYAPDLFSKVKGMVNFIEGKNV